MDIGTKQMETPKRCLACTFSLKIIIIWGKNEKILTVSYFMFLRMLRAHT